MVTNYFVLTVDSRPTYSYISKKYIMCCVYMYYPMKHFSMSLLLSLFIANMLTWLCVWPSVQVSMKQLNGTLNIMISLTN